MSVQILTLLSHQRTHIFKKETIITKFYIVKHILMSTDSKVNALQLNLIPTGPKIRQNFGLGWTQFTISEPDSNPLKMTESAVLIATTSL